MRSTSPLLVTQTTPPQVTPTSSVSEGAGPSVSSRPLERPTKRTREATTDRYIDVHVHVRLHVQLYINCYTFKIYVNSSVVLYLTHVANKLCGVKIEWI